MSLKISVIIPTLNSQLFLGYCLKSIVDNVDEIIIVDMMSIDNTQKIAEMFGGKIRWFSAKSLTTQGHHDLDTSIYRGLSLATGNVVIRMDDDWLWSPNVCLLRRYCEANLEHKNGLRGSVYNMITAGEYFLPVREHFIAMFRKEADPLISFGSYKTDSNTICHRHEIKRSSGREFVLMKRSRYVKTPLCIAHWKFLKDTESEFVRKWVLFTGSTQKEAKEQWKFYHRQVRAKLPKHMLTILYEEAERLVPFGGFDIRGVV